MACPTHDTNMSSERSAAHDCIDAKGRRLEYRSGQTLLAPGYMCISMYACRVKRNGVQRGRWALQQRAFWRMLRPFLSFFSPCRHGRVDSVCSYYSHRPRFDPELWHLSNQQAARMLNTHLDCYAYEQTWPRG